MLIGIDASRIAAEDKTGTENYSYNLIKSLAKIDKSNRYVLYFNQPPQFFEIGQPNFAVKILKAPRFWTQGRLAFECLIRPPDVLFVPAHTIPVVRRPGLTTLVTVHDLGAEFLREYHQFPQKLYLNWSTNYIAKNATHLIAVSEATKKDLMTTYKLRSSTISVVHEGVNREAFHPCSEAEIQKVRGKYGLVRNYVLFVGTVQPRKNLVRLIEAFAKARQKNLDLVIAGSRGWLSDEIYSAPAKFGVEKPVKFLGYVDSEDLPALYSGSLFLAFPSLYEGFGLPILEAMSCETPVLTSKIGATAEVALESAFLVDPNDTDEIATAIVKLAVNPNLREKLSQKGRERASNFSWEKTARETLKVFEKVYKG